VAFWPKIFGPKFAIFFLGANGVFIRFGGGSNGTTLVFLSCQRLKKNGLQGYLLVQ